MTTKNKNNSIVFLTTLSVYLGLVLVGGTSPVLTQSTLDTQVNRKINTKDKLACKSFSSETENLYSSGFFVKPIDDILKYLQQLSKEEGLSYYPFIDLFKVNYDVQAVDGSIVGLFPKDDNFPTYSSETRGFYAILNNNTINLVSELPDKKFRITNFENSSEENATLQKVKFELTQSEFTAQISFEVISIDKANQFATLFNKTFELGRCRSNSQKLLYENTKASAENNQVFIVTRLPRGSLDALLAKDAY